MIPKIAGALLGTAAGDVLGVALEGATPEVAAARVAAGDLPPVGARYTDDTQQALVVSYHLLEHGGIVPEQLARELAALAGGPDRPGVLRGGGPGFAAFVAALAGGVPAEDAAQPSAGNGAAMRSAPIAIHVHERRHLLIDEALAAAAVTHADPRGVAAGVALPAAIVLAAEGVEGPDLVYDVAEEVTEAEHHVFGGLGLRFAAGDRWHTLSTALRAAAPLVGGEPMAVSAAIGRHAATTAHDGSASGTHPYAVASVVTAITLAAGAGDDPGAVGAAVALGGDADTVGAMVGAIIGARRGTDPWPWMVPNAELLVDVGRRLATGGDAAGLPDLHALEAAV